MHRAAHHRAEIDRGDGAGRTGGETVRLERRDEGRQAEALGDAAGDQAEQALVPALGGEEQQRPRRIGGKFGVGRGESFLEHALFDRLAFGIERFELGGNAARLDLVVGRQQPRAEARSADPAAGIDARAEDETERVAGRRRRRCGPRRRARASLDCA